METLVREMSFAPEALISALELNTRSGDHPSIAEHALVRILRARVRWRTGSSKDDLLETLELGLARSPRHRMRLEQLLEALGPAVCSDHPIGDDREEIGAWPYGPLASMVTAELSVDCGSQARSVLEGAVEKGSHVSVIDPYFLSRDSTGAWPELLDVLAERESTGATVYCVWERNLRGKGWSRESAEEKLFAITANSSVKVKVKAQVLVQMGEARRPVAVHDRALGITMPREPAFGRFYSLSQGVKALQIPQVRRRVHVSALATEAFRLLREPWDEPEPGWQVEQWPLRR